MKFHRSAELLCRHGREQSVWPDWPFAAEGAAYERIDHPHIFGLQSVGARENALYAFHELSRVPNSELILAFPGCDGARHFNRVMRLSRRGIGLLNFDQAGVVEGGLYVAFVQLDGLAAKLLWLPRAIPGRVHLEQW